MMIRKFLRTRYASLKDNEDGVVLVEVLLALPFLTLLTIGILEFGNVFWQREKLATGLRDASRYLARCPVAATFDCEIVARNLAFYGTVDGAGPLRVPNWSPQTASIVFGTQQVGTPTGASARDVVYQVITASSSHTILHSGLFAVLGISDVEVFALHHQRVIGR